jgi:hypothetical protein
MEKTFGSKGMDGRATHEEYLNVCKVRERSYGHLSPDPALC